MFRKSVRKNSELINVTPIIRGLPEGVKLCYIKAVKSFGGERKRLALLRAIVSNPTLIILDEPTAGLDPGNQELVWNIIEGIGRNVTRIVATHDVERAMIADCVVVIKNGTIVECGNPRELLNCNSLYKELQTKDKRYVMPLSLFRYLPGADW